MKIIIDKILDLNLLNNYWNEHNEELAINPTLETKMAFFKKGITKFLTDINLNNQKRILHQQYVKDILAITGKPTNLTIKEI